MPRYPAGRRQPMPCPFDNNTLRVAAACAAFASLTAAAAPSVAPTPMIPSYGQSVALQLKDAAWPTYLPVSRYSRNGNHITVEYEILANNFDASRSDFGYKPVGLGELPAGNYTVTGRIFDMANPHTPPIEVSTQFAVVPPETWG